MSIKGCLWVVSVEGAAAGVESFRVKADALRRAGVLCGANGRINYVSE
jgi:hypothetical protein